MNYNCPKCRCDLRWRYKGLVRQRCPACQVTLYRTRTDSEDTLMVRVDLYVWGAVPVISAVLAIIYLLLRGSLLLWPCLVLATVAMVTWFYRLFWPPLPANSPRWTDRKPW